PSSVAEFPAGHCRYPRATPSVDSSSVLVMCQRGYPQAALFPLATVTIGTLTFGAWTFSKRLCFSTIMASVSCVLSLSALLMMWQALAYLYLLRKTTPHLPMCFSALLIPHASNATASPWLNNAVLASSTY